MIAKCIIKRKFPKEKPVGTLVDHALAALDQWFTVCSALAVETRRTKCPKLSEPRQAKTRSADRSLGTVPTTKRQRLKPPETTGNIPNPKDEDHEDVSNQVTQIMDTIIPILPRVGKKMIDDPKILQMVQKVFPEKIIKAILACKGTERTMAPPENLSAREAPFRRAIMKLRSTGKIMTEDWEKYDELSKRRIIRKSQPCRVNITVFAANPMQVPQSTSSTEAGVPSANGSAEMPFSRMESPISSMDPNRGTEGSRETTESTVPEEIGEPAVNEIPKNGSQIQMDPGVSSAKSNRFLSLPREEQSMLRRAHQNLCHPSPEQLSAVLRMQGARPEITQAVFDMKCATCASQQLPRIARPSTLKHELDFNDKVFIDGVTWTSKLGKTFHFYHMLDQATNYHVATPAPNRAAEQASQCVAENWFQWAGPPNVLMTDAGTEFTSEHFMEFLQKFDVKPVTAAPHAHWQNGRCERHGHILQTMLNKIDHDMPIQTYTELQRALVQCTHAKNALSIRKGFSPEVLVFGKSSRLPGSIISCESMSSLSSADRDDAHGIAFRQSLALREKARVAFHQADNDQVLRRACLRRTRPDRNAYEAGEWVMLWQPEAQGGHWFGPLKVVAHEGQNSLWATQAGKLYRRALEHVRPVCSSEANQIPKEEFQNSNPTQNSLQVPDIIPHEDNPALSRPNQHENNPESSNNQDNQSQSQDQPDTEPEASHSPPESISAHGNDPAVEVPVPDSTSDEGDDSLITTHLLCCEDEIMHVDPSETPCAWKCELEAPGWIESESFSQWSPDDLLIATTEKKQRTEVKLSVLSKEEQQAFAQAKTTEVQNWLKTGTVSRILRAKLAPEQILRCRWILTWKPLDEAGKDMSNPKTKLQTHKPKARLVVLGYMDPQITEVPRDSPTLGKQSKMILLQLISSMGWSLGSFDIKAAFLQGKPQKDRVIGLDPVVELASAMNLKPGEICKLDKSAYGLIDAPFLWFQTLQEELTSLGFTPCPFDPYVFILRHPQSQQLSGVLGIHVDDGIHGGDKYFQDQIAKLESKYPFGSKKSKVLTFTGIDMKQNSDNSIELSQSTYVRNINPINLKAERRAQENEPVTEEERHLLRGLIGSLQYAAVHTRPDLTSSLSQLQSQINSATVMTLIMANKTLHIAKKHHDVTIKINPIAVNDLRFLAFSDASFASKTKPESYSGMIILATHKEISRNKSCIISPLSWGTKKIQRVVTSTLSAEATALSTTLDQLTWIRVYWAWLIDPKIPWQKPETVKTLPEALTVPTIKVDEKDLAITDCKSLYDLTTRTAVPNCQEFRTQLLARSIKDILTENICLHWVHSGAQLADALTKVMEGQFLRETLRQGHYCLHDANEVLKSRANARNRLKWLRMSASEMS